MPAAEPLLDELTDAVYRAALEPPAWGDVMALMKRAFPSVVQTFYVLHTASRRIQPVSLCGIEPRWIRSFNELYFAPDNPWMRVSKALHQPGIVRTNERLDRVVRQRGALYHSSYFNEWMKPQQLKYTIGNTLLSEGGIVANITLMRGPDMPTFSRTEVRAFETVSRHTTRALQLSMRLDRSEASRANTALLDAMPQPMAIVGPRRQVLHANAAMEALLRQGRGLVLRQCRLELPDAVDSASKAQLAACLDAALAAGLAGAAPVRLPGADGRPLCLTALPLPGPLGRSLIARPTALVMVAEVARPPHVPGERLCQRHGLTPAEGRLADALASGQGLRQAAHTLGVTYGTARAYLKTVFDKLGVHSQAQLVARLLGDAAAHAE